jgi:hypothetical protein
MVCASGFGIHVNGPIYEKSYRKSADADIVSAFLETPFGRSEADEPLCYVREIQTRSPSLHPPSVVRYRPRRNHYGEKTSKRQREGY